MTSIAEAKTLNYQELADKKRDFPALIIKSADSRVVYTHSGTGPNYEKVFEEFNSFHEQPLGISLLASLSESDRTALQNWLDILYDETYVELMMPEDIMKLCPSFSLTWTDGQNYEVRFEAIKTGKIYGYVLSWLEPHGQNQQQRLAAEIIELMRELRQAPREVINNLRDYLPEVNENVNLLSYAQIDTSSEFLNRLSRSLHAVKGTVFFMGFFTLGNACHEAESKLEELRNTWTLEQGIQPINDILSQLYLLLNLAEGICTRVYNTTAQSEEGHLSLPIHQYYEALDTATELFEQTKQKKNAKNPVLMEKLYHSLIRFDAITITSLFERLNSSTAQLAKELNKSVAFSILPDAPIVYLPHRLFDSLWNALYQVLKNAIDHGVESKEVRLARKKPKVAQIALSVTLDSQDNLVIRLRDDGKGIDTGTIIETAMTRGLISAKEKETLENSPPEEVHKLLFLPGFSTQAEVTTISGRGVGTDVIRKEVESYSGSISVVSQVGEWTEFILCFPVVSNHIFVES